MTVDAARPGDEGRRSTALAALGAAAMLSATLATLLMWTLLTAPVDVARAGQDAPDLFKVVLSVLQAAVRRLLEWI